MIYDLDVPFINYRVKSNALPWVHEQLQLRTSELQFYIFPQPCAALGAGVTPYHLSDKIRVIQNSCKVKKSAASLAESYF